MPDQPVHPFSVMNIPILLDRLCYRYPSLLVDAITEHEAGRRIVAVKNVTVNEEFFQGHFPGAPLMPGVLMIESLAQVATILLLHARRRAAPTRACTARRRRREVPPRRWSPAIGCGSKSRSAGGAARIARAQRRRRSSTSSVVAEAELVWLGSSDRRDAHADDPRDGDRAPARAASATARSSARYVDDRRARHDRRELPHRRVGVIDGGTDDRRRQRDLSVRVDRPGRRRT